MSNKFDLFNKAEKEMANQGELIKHADDTRFKEFDELKKTYDPNSKLADTNNTMMDHAMKSDETERREVEDADKKKNKSGIEDKGDTSTEKGKKLKQRKSVSYSSTDGPTGKIIEKDESRKGLDTQKDSIPKQADANDDFMHIEDRRLRAAAVKENKIAEKTKVKNIGKKKIKKSALEEAKEILKKIK